MAPATPSHGPGLQLSPCGFVDLSIRWLHISSLYKEPVHQQPWYWWPFVLEYSGFSTRRVSHHNTDITWASCHLKTPVNYLFVQQFGLANMKITIKAYESKYQSLHNWPFVRGVHQSLVDSPHKGPVMRKAFPWCDVVMMAEISEAQLPPRVLIISDCPSCSIIGVWLVMPWSRLIRFQLLPD